MSDSFDNLISEQPKKKPNRGRRLWVGLVVTLSVLALLVCGVAVWGYSVTVSEKNLPNVCIDGIAVGGLNGAETAAALEKAGWHGLDAENLAVTLPAGAGFEVDAVRSGAVLSRDSAVAAAHAYGRDGNVFTNLLHYLSGLLLTHNITAADRPLDEQYIRACIETGQENLNRRLARASYVADIPGAKLVLFKGAGGAELDREALYAAVTAALRERKTALAFDTLKSEPPMPDFEALYQELRVEAQDASFNEYFEVIPEVVGVSFDVEQAKELWKAAKLGEQAVVPLTLTQPEVRGEDLKALLFRDVLGSNMTYYTWSTAERVNNIRLAAAKLDGLILLPGEAFSYNETIGQRTEEAGFQIAKAYSDGQEVDALGGGICQVSSTLYAATMYARLKTLSRTNHYFKVGYTDYGMDATVSWGQPDFKFRNDRDYPIKLAAYLNEDEESLVVEIWGTDVDGCTVKLRHNETEVFDEEFPEVLIGYSVNTYGDIYDAEGNYVDTVYENSGVYYFHDEDIEWPQNAPVYRRNSSQIPDEYMNPS